MEKKQMKKYLVVNNFTDIHTNEFYTSNHEPIEFSDERVAEIQKVENIIGYKLIKEYTEDKSEEVVEEITSDEEKSQSKNKKNK